MKFPEAEQGIPNLLDKVWPIGSVYISVNSINPSLFMGIGTWVLFGAGKTLVGVDIADPLFDTPEEVGGAKTHTLLTNEMPAHTHLQNAHSHVENVASAATGGLVGSTPDASTNTPVASGYSTANTTAVNQNAGGGLPHNNLQPYITVYFWKRVG